MLYAGGGNAVYASADGGSNWQPKFQAPASARVTALAIDPMDRRTVLAGTTRGLYGSFDSGEHWQRLHQGVGEGESSCLVVRFHPSQPGAVWLGTGGGLLISSDGGRTWKAAAGLEPARAMLDLAFVPGEPERLYAVTDRGVFLLEAPHPWTRVLPSATPEQIGRASCRERV